MAKPSKRGRVFVTLDMQEAGLAAWALQQEMAGWRVRMSRPDFKSVPGFEESVAEGEALLKRLLKRLADVGLKL